uniref:Uncharacterized protein n=1 Tax=Clastoptera arizonana TaxID=38151 RepID=A0A1B6D482_9HEMI
MLLLSSALILVVCQLSVGAYPVFGTKRYGRSLTSWSPLPLPYYQPSRPYVSSYYEPEYYYPQDPYSYIPMPDKYPVYQSLVPYYYSDQRRPYGYYNYEDGTEPLDNVQEDVLDDETEGEPYGQETWFNNPQDGNAEANAMFLQNLITAQMYNDRNEAESDSWVYGEPKSQPSSTKEDEDVRELKSLLRKEPENKKSRREDVDDMFGGQLDGSRKRWQHKRSEKTVTSTEASLRAAGPGQGQKEVVLPRPANPVRAPHFQKFVTTRSREPSVYDTIKKLLNMQDQNGPDTQIQNKKKRSYNSNEDALVAQLGGLKKSA